MIRGFSGLSAYYFLQLLFNSLGQSFAHVEVLHHFEDVQVLESGVHSQRLLMPLLLPQRPPHQVLVQPELVGQPDEPGHVEQTAEAYLLHPRVRRHLGQPQPLPRYPVVFHLRGKVDEGAVGDVRQSCDPPQVVGPQQRDGVSSARFFLRQFLLGWRV